MSGSIKNYQATGYPRGAGPRSRWPGARTSPQPCTKDHIQSSTEQSAYPGSGANCVFDLSGCFKNCQATEYPDGAGPRSRWPGASTSPWPCMKDRIQSSAEQSAYPGSGAVPSTCPAASRITRRPTILVTAREAGPRTSRPCIQRPYSKLNGAMGISRFRSCIFDLSGSYQAASRITSDRPCLGGRSFDASTAGWLESITMSYASCHTTPVCPIGRAWPSDRLTFVRPVLWQRPIRTATASARIPRATGLLYDKALCVAAYSQPLQPLSFVLRLPPLQSA